MSSSSATPATSVPGLPWGSEATRYSHLTVTEIQERVKHLESRPGRNEAVHALKSELDGRLEWIGDLSTPEVRSVLRSTRDATGWADVISNRQDLSQVPEAFLGPRFRTTGDLLQEEKMLLRLGGPLDLLKAGHFQTEYMRRIRLRQVVPIQRALQETRRDLENEPDRPFRAEGGDLIVIAMWQLPGERSVRTAQGAALYRELYIRTRELELDLWRHRVSGREERVERLAQQLMEAWHPPHDLMMSSLEARLKSAIRDTAQAETAAVRKQLFQAGDRLRENMFSVAPVLMEDGAVRPSTKLGRSMMEAKQELARIYGRVRMLPVAPEQAARYKPRQLKALADWVDSRRGKALQVALRAFPKTALIQGMVKQAASVTVRSLTQETHREQGY